MIALSSRDFDHLVGFQGYGNPSGKYWFIGLEEGFKPKNKVGSDAELRHEIKVRATWNATEDIHRTRESLGLNMRGGSPAWNAMSLMALRFDGADDWRTPVPYKEERLARADGDTFLTELFPLPTSNHDAKQWPYSSPYAERADYEEAVLRHRTTLIRDLWSHHAPRYVICYGKGDDWNPFKRIFPGVYFQLVNRDGEIGNGAETTRQDQAQIGRIGFTTVVFTWHLSGMNYDPLARVVDATLQFESRHIRLN